MIQQNSGRNSKDVHLKFMNDTWNPLDNHPVAIGQNAKAAIDSFFW